MTNKITLETRRESHQLSLLDQGNNQQKVLTVLSTHDYGLTAEEIAAKLHWPTYVTRPRITELMKKGRIVVIGKKLSPVTNRNIAVFKIASDS